MSASPAELLSIADSVLEAAGRDSAEVAVVEQQHSLTRFARNQIHQNVTETSRRIRLRVVAADRVGVAEVRGEVEGATERLVTTAEAARLLAPAGEVTPLPKPDAGPDGPVAFSRATAESTPEWRASQVRAIARPVAAAGFEAFGVVETSVTQTVVVSGTGTRRRAESSTASMTCLTRGEAGWGYAARHHSDVNRLDAEALAHEAVQACGRNQGATSLEPGVYPVVLAPYAVAELVAHLADLGFSAQAHQERRSFMRPGERLMSERLTVVDDAADLASMPFPFDDEGVSTRGVSCVEEGVCRGFVHDSATALRENVPSTGHALPMPNTYGPWARHLVVSPGDRSLEDLLVDCGTGLYVTRLWYVRDVHPLHTIITGMTRDGTFLIDQGRLGRPVRDLRFTQSIVEALAEIRGVGRDRSIELDEGERALLVPAVCLGHFAFTS
ncbi:MAG TPA: TldD/PmbA family protein [Candidatus Binatia bacterium]|nr:TldD/PmbA family protein [Candidatus Binatia bacterium]